MANGWNPLIGIGFTALGVGYLYEAFHKKAAPTPVGGQKTLGYAGPAPKGEPLVVKDGVRTIKFYPAGDISQRVGYIIAQMRKDAASPEVISEATAILSRKCPVDPRSGVRGLKWCIEPKDWKTEKLALFYHSLVDPNSKLALRYTRDPEKFDGFRSAALMRRIPAGDCFVHGTLVLRDDYKMVPVETLRVGDRIWGLDKWTAVTQTWEKGVLPTWLIKLNNGSSMRLTPDHKVWVIENGEKRVVRVRELTKKMQLIQPESVQSGFDAMDSEEAWIEGVFVADGWIDSATRFAIAGKDGHPKEEQKRRVERFFAARGVKTTWHKRYIYVYSREWVERLSRCGKGAPNKRVSSLSYASSVAKALLAGVMADASTNAKTGLKCLTTTSRTLFLQTRVLEKMNGVTCSERFIPDHGGLGRNPIWRLQERLTNETRSRAAKVLRVKEIVKDGVELPCFDFATEDQHIWLPEADWTVHNCDDFVIRLGALLMAVGYSVKARVVAPAGQPGQWAHIYLVASDEPGNPNPSKWYALDPTEPQHGPFWEVPDRLISSKKDFAA